MGHALVIDSGQPSVLVETTLDTASVHNTDCCERWCFVKGAEWSLT